MGRSGSWVPEGSIGPIELEDLRRLRYFVAVAEEASFTRAARRLLVSQPTVSEAVGQLERALGVRLVMRGERPVALTRAGSVLLEDARALLASAERATARVRRVAAGDEGDLVIASTQSLSAGFVPTLVARLEQSVPRLRTRHRLGWMSDVIDSVNSGSAKVGFGRYVPPTAGLRHATLGHEPVVACLGADDPRGRDSTLGLKELAHERWAIMDRSMAPRWYDVFMASCAAARVDPEIAEFVAAADLTAAQATWRRVAAGELVTYVGASVIPLVARFGVRCVPMDASLPPLPVDAVWREDEPLANSVVAVAREVCRGAWWDAEPLSLAAEPGATALP